VDVALASVLSSAVVGLAGLGTAIYGIRVSRRQVREERVEGRRADAYLELLTLVEAEGQWVETYLQSHQVESTYTAGDIRPIVAKRPAPTEKGRARAIVMAYGSGEVQRAWAQWIDAVKAIDDEYQELAYAWANPARGGHIDSAELKNLAEPYGPAELSRRLELSALVALQLNWEGSELHWAMFSPDTHPRRRLAFWRR
jgi:hypothetical protein